MEAAAKAGANEMEVCFLLRQYLISLRQEQDISQYVVADKANMSQSYYHAIEHGDRQRSMDFSIMESLAHAFDVPLSLIVEAESEYRKCREMQERGH